MIALAFNLGYNFLSTNILRRIFPLTKAQIQSSNRPEQYQRVTGMRDVLFEEQRYWRFILAKIQATVDLFGYQKLDTPLLEPANLFVRGVGEGTDIVEKEMYIFEDRDGSRLALRPEFTAGIMRAYIENGLHTLPSPLRVWTVGPLFRHERPQAGRYRQHSQFDIEVIGEQDPAVDVEVISLAWHLFTSLGFHGLPAGLR